MGNFILISKDSVKVLLKYARLGRDILHPAIYQDQSELEITEIIESVEEHYKEEKT